LRNHRRAAYNAPQHEYEGLTTPPAGIDVRVCPKYLLDASRQESDRMLALGEKHGYRNAQVTVLAPTGCLVHGTMVVTDRGIVPIGTLGDVNGDKWQDVSFNVQTDDGEQKATKFFLNGVAPTRRIRTAGGYEVQGTLQHRMKVVDPATGKWQWKCLSDVQEGDIIPLAMGCLIGEPCPVKLPPLEELYWASEPRTVVPRMVTPALSELVGYFMG